MHEEPEAISQSHLATGRAVDQLRRQLGIVFQEDDGTTLGACPIEGVTPAALANLRGGVKNRLYLLLTGARARNLGLDAAQARAVLIDAQSLTLAQMLALADPLQNDTPPPPVKLLPATPSHDMLLLMARYASLLPAMLIIESDALPGDWLRVTAADVNAYWSDPPIDIVALTQAQLPIEGAEDAILTCFRTRWGTSTHLALTIGKPDRETAPLVRVHSSCITGDILGSLRCDCGDQLQLALKAITQAGSGVLIYLHQEGRGIGIANKLRAYTLQERGIDTYDANLMLGLGEDERDFSIAAGILKKLGVRKIKLLTNNPEKLAALEQNGIDVVERVTLMVPASRHNHDYLEAKEKKAGHMF